MERGPVRGAVVEGIRAVAHRVGYDIRRWHPERTFAASRDRILRETRATVALDVGAWVGEWAREVRDGGFGGRIVSFEPQGRAFATLEERAASDPRWDCVQLALGSEEAAAEMNISAAGFTNSLLRVEQVVLDGVPAARPTATETVQVKRLDGMADELGAERLYLKIDTQGYEMEVLRGAEPLLPVVHAIEIELSLVANYKDQSLFGETVEYLRSLEFELAALQPGFYHPSGRLLQADGIFQRD